jgi:uncharacterized protein with ParB-like and HNH nuclease domain
VDLVGAKLKNFYEFTNKNEGENRLKPQEVLVKIPHYQRPYEWTEDNVALLVNDTLDNTQGQYFSGASVSSIHNEHCHELVDGQQRYTTLFLINYCIFLISRVALREALTIGAYVHAKSLAEILKKSIEYIFVLHKDSSDGKLEVDDIEKKINLEIKLDDPDYTKIAELKNQIKQLKETDNNANELCYRSFFDKKYQELLKYISEKGNSSVKDGPDEVLEKFYAMKVISNLKQQDERYFIDNSNLIRYFFDNSKFRITYARNKYIDLIKESLLSIDFKLSSQESLILVNNNAKLDTSYQKAINAIFEQINIRVTEKDPLENAVQLLINMTTILEKLDVCVVQTGNQSDATVLFDVLNDRSKELSQLSLIKNEFYKRVVIYNDKNKILSDDELDKHLDKIDGIWVDDIFNASASDASLVSYLGCCFLSASTSVNFSNNGKETRDTISNYLQSQTKYTVGDLEFDISVFHAVKVILRKVGVKYQKLNDTSLTSEAEYKSIFERVVKLLMAKKQEGILSGLINYILWYVLTKQIKRNEIDISRLEEELDKILDSSYDDVNKQSLEFWVSSLSSKDYTSPRILSKQLIDFYNKKTAINSGVIPNSLLFSRDKSARADLKSWLSEWKYRSSNQFEIKVLLINLMRLDPSKGVKLVDKKPQFFSGFINSSCCHLDHFEPKSLPSINSSAYFQSENRDDLVNSIGNMMLLTQIDNQRKSDVPAIEADNYYSKSDIAGNWLYRALHDKFVTHSKNDVPEESFFTERKKELISLIVDMLHN